MDSMETIQMKYDRYQQRRKQALALLELRLKESQKLKRAVKRKVYDSECIQLPKSHNEPHLSTNMATTAASVCKGGNTYLPP